MNFETAIRQQLEAKPRLTLGDKRILAILDARPSRRRDRQIERMTRHAAAAANLTGDPMKIDWSTVDWGSVFAVVIGVLIRLLPLLLL